MRLHAVIEGELADVVAVVEGDGAHLLELEHAFDVAGHGVERLLEVALGIGLAKAFGRLQASCRWGRSR